MILVRWLDGRFFMGRVSEPCSMWDTEIRREVVTMQRLHYRVPINSRAHRGNYLRTKQILTLYQITTFSPPASPLPQRLPLQFLHPNVLVRTNSAEARIP